MLIHAAPRLRMDQLGDLAAELEAEYGPVPADVRAQTRRQWPGYDPGLTAANC